MRIRLYIFAFFLGLNLSVQAQQDALYSQYMFNGLILNPAYAGSRDLASMTLINRWQWTGIEEAPRSFMLGFHTPTPDRRHGLGLGLLHDKIWVLNNTVLDLNYAYRIPIKKATLALGLRGGFQYYTADFSQIPVKQGGDPVFEGNGFRRLIPTTGAGIYFQSETFYLGASTPNFLKGRLYTFEMYDLSYAERHPHFYFTGGMVIKASEDFRVRYSALLRYVQGVPLSADLNLGLVFRDFLWVGMGLRVKSALNFMAEWRINEQFRIGYAYDVGVAGIAKGAGGSHELRLGIDFGFKKYGMFSPRLYF